MAPSLSILSWELVRNIVDQLDDLNDIARLALVCRATYSAANCELYKRASKLQHLLCWATEFGRVETVRWLLNSGADAAKPWWKESKARNPKGRHLYAWELKDPSWSPIQTLHLFYNHNQRTNVTSHDEDEDERPLPQPSPRRFNPEDMATTVIFEAGENSVLPRLSLDKPLILDFASGPNLKPWSSQWFPLHLAAMGGHLEIADLLLRHGADLNATAWKICACSHTRLRDGNRQESDEAVCCGFWYNDEIWSEWLDKPFCLDRYSVTTPLHVALCHQQEEMAIMLLQRGAAHDFGSERSKVHILHTAAAHGCLEVLKFLLGSCSHVVDVNLQDSNGLTPLFYAYKMHHRETMLWLLENDKIDVDFELGAGLTLLHLACLDGASNVASLLIDAGADVNRPWAETICPYLGQLRPLEICCALQPTDPRTTLTLADAMPHQPKFERRKLELMKKLLDSGAGVSPIARPDSSFNDAIPFPQFSAMTIAAAHHSIPMLQLLFTSGADFTREDSAIHEAMHPSFMNWENVYNRNPLPTLRWLVAHGVPLDPVNSLTIEAVASICAQPIDIPWKIDVLDWLGKYRIDNNTKLVIAQYDRGSHPIHPMFVNGSYHSYLNTTPFWEALRVSDFAACRSLLRSGSRPDPVEAFHDLLERVEKNGNAHGGYPSDDPNSFLEDRERNYQFLAQLKFLLEVDEDEVIKSRPETFLDLLSGSKLYPSSLLLDSLLPTKEAMLSLSPTFFQRDVLLLSNLDSLYDLRDQQDSTQRRRVWDSAIRLAASIISENWTAAHFLLDQGAETSWADEEGMEHFPPVLSALRLAPSPSVIGYDEYGILLAGWHQQQPYDQIDICTALFFAACVLSADIVPFLAAPGVDVNCVDSRGYTALHKLYHYLMRDGHLEPARATEELDDSFSC